MIDWKRGADSRIDTAPIPAGPLNQLLRAFVPVHVRGRTAQIKNIPLKIRRG